MDGSRLVGNLGNVEVSFDGHALALRGELASARERQVMAAKRTWPLVQFWHQGRLQKTRLSEADWQVFTELAEV
ncbi:hypothetical protein [Variovorax soli]|uniref:Uncharacterized protein n=1 Tax=Variovorax soli TaxID=376815 RepID=A0ABU1NLH4_9BURK|nr:hypothetical protein [Variovorax soli]MDR6539197.1 hypothetical protein [Variovorax soli]